MKQTLALTTLAVVLTLAAPAGGLVWDNQPPPDNTPPGTAAITRRVVDDHLIVGVSVHEHDRVLRWDGSRFQGTDGRYAIHHRPDGKDDGYTGGEIRSGPPTHPGNTTRTLKHEGRGTIRIPCHLFHGKYLTINIGGPHPQTTTETINCGTGFIPNQPLPAPLLRSEGKTAPGEAKSAGPIRPLRVRDGWVTVDVKIDPAPAVYWLTPGEGQAEPGWLYDVDIKRVWPDRRTDEGLAVSPYTLYARLNFGKQTQVVRHSGGWQMRFECGHGYQQVKVTLKQAREQTSGAGAGVYYHPVGKPSVITIPDCDEPLL